MIFIVTVVLLVFGDCTPGGSSGGYSREEDLLDGFKNSASEVELYGQNDYVLPFVVEKKHKTKNEGYLEEYNSYGNNHDNYDDNKDDKWGDGEYEYEKNQCSGFDTKEYDYLQKCDINAKDCKDGRDCYDKSRDRSGYDNCKNQYGDEGRYYDIDDRYSGNRYREDNIYNRYEIKNYDKNTDDFDNCRNNRKRNDFDKDCYDNTKNRGDFNKCRQYYTRCRSVYNIHSYNEKDWNCYYEDNLIGIGRKDREDQLIRPCALNDRQCIRKFLAANSKCKPAYGPISDPLHLKRNTVYFPLAKLTFIRTRVRVIGLASIKISEFYVNKDTKNLVIALDFEKLNQTSPKIYFRYHRTAKESIVLSDYASDQYQSGRFTAVIPMVPDLRLDLADVHADLDDLVPRVIIGPRAVNKDPDVIASAAIFFANLPLITREFFFFTSQLFTSIYIQENLCDFGLKLTSS